MATGLDMEAGSGPEPSGDSDQIPAGYEKASPEDQALYNKFVGLAKKAIFDPQAGLPATLNLLKSTSDPIEAVAEAAVGIAGRVVGEARKGGVDLPGDVLLNGGAEIVSDIAELAEAAGIAQLSDQDTEQAFYLAADKWAQKARQIGIYDDQRGQQDLAALNQQADAGGFNDLIPSGGKAGGMR